MFIITNIRLIICLSAVMFVATLLTVQLVYADYYKYIDDSGEIVYTDNLSNVPVSKRGAVGEIDTGDSVSVFSEAEVAPASENTIKNVSSDLDAMEKLIEEERQLLDGKLEDLSVRQLRLKQAVTLEMTVKEKQNHISEVQTLNDEIVQFTNERELFIKKVEHFNLMVDQVNMDL